jgi:acyl-coenzyme A thioesterase PaaI-like protein
MADKAIQDHYPDALAHCYGCGRLNPHGLHIESHWDGQRGIATFRPLAHQIAIPGFVYGGLIASLIDCHAIGTAAAAATDAAGHTLDSNPDLRFVTASLHVDYLAPTPIDTVLELCGTAAEIKPNKVTVDVTLTADGRACARGRVIAVRMPATMRPREGNDP